jgi:hypothetical protein
MGLESKGKDVPENNFKPVILKDGFNDGESHLLVALIERCLI